MITGKSTVKKIIIILFVSFIFPAIASANQTSINSKFIVAVCTGETELVKNFLDKGADINARNSDGHTALIIASKAGYTETVRTLLDKGADIEEKSNKTGATALMAASSYGYIETVRLLIGNGARINANDDIHRTALMFASAHGHVEICKLLIENGAALSNVDLTALSFAAYNGHIEVVKLLLNKGANINYGNAKYPTALIYASKSGNTEIVKILLDNGADINTKNNDGWTALMIASELGHIETVKILIDKGADVNAKNSNGLTALEFADQKGYANIVNLLATGDEYKLKMELLGTVSLASNDLGEVSLESFEKVKVLLGKGADVNAKDNEGNTSLMFAAIGGQIDLVRVLLDKGADINEKNIDHWTALMFVAELGNTEIARLLIDKKADINATTNNGITALMIASANGNFKTVELLLGRGADINATTKKGNSALDFAKKENCLEIAYLLQDKNNEDTKPTINTPPEIRQNVPLPNSTSKLGSEQFHKGIKLLTTETYEGSSKKRGALDYFKEAIQIDSSWRDEIANQLIQFGNTLVQNGDTLNLIGLDAKEVYEDALSFDSKKKKPLIYELKDSYSQNHDKSVLYVIKSLYNDSDQAITNEFLTETQETRQKDTKNHNLQNAFLLYDIAFALCNDLPDIKNRLIRELRKNSQTFLTEDKLSDYMNVAKYVKENSESEENYEFFINNARAYLVFLSENNHFKESIQQFNIYIKSIDDDLTDEDKDLVKIIFFNAMSNYSVPGDEAYDIFKSALSIDWFKDLDFYFAQDCKYQLNKEENQYFIEKMTQDEQAFFFYDSSRAGLIHKGILFTNEAIIWKNIFSDPIRVNYNDIESITLIYSKGLSLTGWELELNDNDDLKIRLSKLPEEYFAPFMASIIYLINYNSEMATLLDLKIGERAQKALNGEFWAKHKEETIFVTAILAMITGNELRKNEAFRAKMVEIGNNIASNASYVYNGTNNFGRAVTKTTKGTVNTIGRTFKKFTVYKNGKPIGTFRLKELYNKAKTIKMPYVGKGKNASAKGFERNANKFWSEYLKRFPSDLSKKNIQLIKNGKSPVVDRRWVKAYPNHAKFAGEKLEHHHLNHGANAVPIPTTLHRGILNKMIWHDSHLIINHSLKCCENYRPVFIETMTDINPAQSLAT